MHDTPELIAHVKCTRTAVYLLQYMVKITANVSQIG